MNRYRQPRRPNSTDQLRKLMTSATSGNPEAIHRKAGEMGINLNSVYSCGNTLLTKAIEDNEAPFTVEAIIKAGADVDHPNRQGNTALMTAVILRRPELFKVLIQYGADPKLKTPKNSSAISLCLKRGLYSYLEILMKQNINNVDSMIEKLKEICSYLRRRNNNNHKDTTTSDFVCPNLTVDSRLISAIKNVYDVNLNDMNGTTPLMYVVRCHYDNCVRLLLLAGADVNRINKSKETALTLAMTRPHNPILKDLIGAGALRRHPRGKTSTLHFGMFKMILDYLQQNGIFNMADIYGKTALNYAVERGDKACIMYAIKKDIEEFVKAKLLLNSKNTTARCVGDGYHAESVSSLCAVYKTERSCKNSDKKFLEDKGKHQDNNDRPIVMDDFETGKMLEELFSGKANLRVNRGDSTIICAIRYCDFLTEEITKFLVGDTRKKQYQDGKTALMIAVSGYNGGSHTYIEPLIGDSCSIQDKDGKTALMYVFINNKLVPRHLLKNIIGDSQNLHDKDGKTALMYAFENNRLVPDDILKQIIGDSQNVQDKDGKTALMYALIYKIQLSEEMIELLAGETPFIQDNAGKTALMYAFECQQNLTHMSIKKLIDCSCCVQDISGQTALVYAIKHNYSLPEYLYEQMIRQSQLIQDNEGKTALVHACNDSHFSNTFIIGLFHRDSLNMQDNEGKTALHYAIEQGQTNEFIEQLILHGSNLEIEDKQKRTALDLFLEIDTRDTSSPSVWREHFVKTKMLLKFNPNPRLGLLGKLSLLKSMKKGLFSLYSLFKYKEIFRLIIVNGIVPFPHLREKMSTLFAVLKENLIDVVKYLIANMYLTNEDLMFLIKAKNYLKSHEYQMSHKMLFNGTYLDLSSPNLQKLITEATSQPWPLVKLSFLVVSSAVGHDTKRKVRVNRLPLPNPIKDSLMFNTRTALIPVSEWSNIPMVFDPVEYDKTRRLRPLLNYWPFGAELVV